MAKARVNVDFAWEEKIQEVLKPIRKHGGMIFDFNPQGPGGGNPQMTIEFSTVDSGVKYLLERYPDDDEGFCLSRLKVYQKGK